MSIDAKSAESSDAIYGRHKTTWVTFYAYI